MQLTLSALRNLPCTVAMLLTAVACGGSTPSPHPVPEPQAAAPEGETPDSAGSAEDGAGDASTRKRLDFRFDPEAGLVLNEMQLPNDALVSELTQRLDPPTREKKHRSGEMSLYHDEQGLVVWTLDGEVMGLGLNFNWDGDEKFPETSFAGSLAVGALKVDRSTTLAQFQALEGGVSCLGESMCAGKSANTKFLVGFKDKTVSQVSFLFPKK